jgi:hypothetical protein
MKKSELEDKMASIYREAEFRFQEAEKEHKDEMETVRNELVKKLRVMSEERDKAEDMLRENFEAVKIKVNFFKTNAR